MHQVIKCQHCGHKNYQPVERGVSFRACTKCGQQTAAKPEPGDAAPPRRLIDNPAAY